MTPVARGARAGKSFHAFREAVYRTADDGPRASFNTEIGLPLEIVRLGRFWRAMFFCVPGFTRDGHEVAPEAIAQGAVALVVERPLNLGVREPATGGAAAMAPAGAALPRRSRAVDVETGLAGSRFTVQTPDGDIAVSAPLRGQFNVYNVLRAFTAARALGVPAETAGRANRDRRTSAGPVRDGGRRPTGRRPGRLCAHAGLARERPAGGEGPGEQRRRVTQTSRARRVGLRRGPGSRQAPANGEIATRLADWVIVTSAAGFSANCPKWGHDGGLRVFLRADGDAELFCGNCHGGDELTEAVRLSACHLRLSAAARLGTAAAPAASSTCARRWRPRPRPSRTVPPFAIDATVTLLVGRPGESKTWLGLVACAAVDGEFDTEPLSYASGRALYLDAENGQRKMGSPLHLGVTHR
jgi:hypothetical protein